jgi:hypothetical protein
MTSGIRDRNLLAKNIEIANGILDTNIEKIMLEGPLQKLQETQYTQPAILIEGYTLFSQ